MGRDDAEPLRADALTAGRDPSEELRLLRAQAGQLRYELSRLQDRRTVRLALAAGELRAPGGLARAWAAVRGRAPRRDVPGPELLAHRPPFPQLWAASTGDGHLLAGACARTVLTPGTGPAVVTRDRPDLLLVDGLTGWGPAALSEVVAAMRGHGGAVVTVGATARGAVADADLHLTRGEGTRTVSGGHGGHAGASTATRAHDPDVRTRDAGGGRVLAVPGAVDVLAATPAGAQPAPAHRRDDAAAVTLAQARRQPVVVLPEVGVIGVDRCLALLSAGAVVIAGYDPGLASALVGLDAGSTAAVLGPPGESPADREVRAATLLGDDDLRHRTSVRLRRHVQRHCATRVVLERIVDALELAARPSRRISVLLATRRADRVDQVLRDLAGQRHDDLEVILLPHGDAPLPERPAVADLQVRRVPADRPLGAVLDAGLDLVTGAYVAKVDDDDRYGSEHLGDLLGALEVSGAAIVGRRSHGVYLEDRDRTVVPAPGGEERYENHLPGGTLLLPADTLRATRWRHVPSAVDTELIRSIHLDGGAAYTSHRYGYVRVRHRDHTWAGDDWGGVATPGFDDTLLEA